MSLHGQALAFRGYYGLGDGQYALYVVRPDGCGMRRLTRSIAGNPSWSPDRNWIAFDTSGEGEIWKVRSNGAGLTRLTSGGSIDQDGSPAWSPDGTKIAFVRYHHLSNGQIWAMRTDGSIAILLHGDARTSDLMPAWSHDGTRIAFVAQAGRHSSIDVMNADGTNVRTLTKGRGETWNPVWLPGDAGIAFLAGMRLFVMRPDGSGVTRLALSGAEQFAWVRASLPRRRC